MELLFIDDDSDDMMLYGEAVRLIDSSVTITKCISAKDALLLLMTKNYEPSLIVLDYRLPLMDGLEFLKILRAEQKWKFLPVVVVTDRCPPSKEEAFQMLRSLCFKKPHTFEGLRELMECILQLFNQDQLSA